MRTTDEARPSETEAAERSELSASVIPIEESKEEEKTLMLSSALAEPVVVEKVKKNSDKKGVEKKDEDETEIQEEMQMSGNGEGVEEKVIETASDLGASGKEVELGENEGPEKDVTEALPVLEQIQIEEKTSLEDVKESALKHDIGEE